MHLIPAIVIITCAGLSANPGVAGQASGQAAQARMDSAVAAGQPLTVHVIVALCDNEHQGIIPVPDHLGNGASPSTNLYWGARYGVRHYLTHDAGWQVIRIDRQPFPGCLERLILHRRLVRDSAEISVYLVAEAWHGAEMKAAVGRFLKITAGCRRDSVSVVGGGDTSWVPVGSAAHIAAYVGHNGLMDFPAPDSLRSTCGGVGLSAIVLACASRSYFAGLLQRHGAHPLLLTTGLMAPEAYTLDAAVTGWLEGATSEEVRRRAARAYDRYQHCGQAAALRLFHSIP